MFRILYDRIKRKPMHRGAARRWARPTLERLEDRLAPAAATFVNDNWNLIADSDSSGTLSAGDQLRNDNDTVNAGGITATYGGTGFGLVTTETVPGNVDLTQDPAFDDINDALANTDPGGTVTVLEGTYNQDVVVNAGDTLAGDGTVGGSMTVNSGGTLAPGLLGAAGTLNTGDLDLKAGAILLIDVRTTVGDGADQLNVSGTVDLTGSTLLINDGFRTSGKSFVLIDNDGRDAVVGTFAGLPEQSVFTAAGGRRFRISYEGGDGNDVVLKALAGGAAEVGAQFILLNPDGSPRFGLTAFASFRGGVAVATGDVNGDGATDIIVGATSAPGGHVKVFDGATGAELRSFLAFPGFTGSISVAAGDINGDGFDDIIVGASANGHVKVFDGQTSDEIRSFLAFPGFTGGVSAASGDINNDGFDDIIVGASTNGHVKVFDGQTNDEIRSFLAFPGFSGGVSVASGDINGDGFDDIVVSTATSIAGGHVKVFSGQDNAILASFFAFDQSFRGVQVSSFDFDGDGVAEIVVGATRGSALPARLLSDPTLERLINLFAFDQG